MVQERDSKSKKTAAGPTPKEEDGARVDIVYYCPNQTAQNFYIPALDTEGKRIPSRLKDGSQKYLNGEPVFIDKLCHFETLMRGTKDNPEKTMCIFTLRATDPDYDAKYVALEKLRLDETSRVMNQVQYDEFVNKTAAKFKYENVALKKQNVALENTIKDMEEKIKALESGKGN